jgi:hypothetical protein
MIHLRLSLAFAGVLAILAASDALGLDAAGILRLKQAGVGDATIELLIRERSVETAAFTVPEIVALKAAGIGEDTLQTLIREGSFMKDREPVVYGNELRSIRLATAQDIIRLKEAGVSDDVLQAIVEVSRRDADIGREQALQSLREMGIWVDLRR